MTRHAALLLFCLAAAPLWADKPLEVQINDFTSGVDSQHLPDKIKGLQNARNFRTDNNFGLKRRDGVYNETAGCSFSTAAALHVWSFTDTAGSNWIIRLDSNGWITAANGLGLSATCLTTAVTGQLSLATDTDADVGLGLFWFTNKTNGLWSWDRTTVTSYPTAPLASRVAIYKNRVVLADISNEQSSIRLSGELNGADWNNDSRFSTSPVSIRIGGVNDGYKVYDFFPGMGEGVTFKANSTYRLLGNDQRDFRVEQISPEIGTIYPNTIAQRGFATLFLSNRGLDAYTPPYTFTPVGNPIQDMIDPLARQSSLSKSLTLDSISDWTAGASSPTTAITTFTIAGDIATNNHTFTDTQKSDWTNGGTVILSTGVSVSTGGTINFDTLPGKMVYMSTTMYTGSVPNFSFETQGAFSSTEAANWVNYPNDGSENLSFLGEDWFRTNAPAAGIVEGLWFMDLDGRDNVTPSASGELFAMTTSSDIVASIPLNLTLGAANITTLNTTMISGTTVFYGLHGNVGDRTALPTYTIRSSTIHVTQPVYLSTSVSVTCYLDSIGGNGRRILCDQFIIGPQRRASEYAASYHSQVFDTVASSPIFDPFRADPSSSGGVNFTVETSTAINCCFKAPISFKVINGTGATPSINRDRYFVYSASFTVNVPTFTITISTIVFGSYATGYFRTSAQDLGTGVSNWGLFTAVDNNGGDGSVSYETQSNSVPSFVESAWTATALNSVPTMPANRYAFARITMQTAASTTTPFVDNLTFNWNIGAGNPKPFASTFREAYYLFFSTSLSNITTNDQIAVYNRDNVFNTFYGSTLAAATVYNNTLMMADALGTGAIYSLDKAVDGMDAGKNIESFFTVRRLDGSVPDADKIFDKVYVTISRQDATVSQIFKVEYSIDGSTTLYRASNVEISTGAALTTQQSSFNSETVNQGHYIDIKISELTRNTMPYTINRMALYGTIKEVP